MTIVDRRRGSRRSVGSSQASSDDDGPCSSSSSSNNSGNDNDAEPSPPSSSLLACRSSSSSSSSTEEGNNKSNGKTPKNTKVENNVKRQSSSSIKTIDIQQGVVNVSYNIEETTVAIVVVDCDNNGIATPNHVGDNSLDMSMSSSGDAGSEYGQDGNSPTFLQHQSISDNLNPNNSNNDEIDNKEVISMTNNKGVGGKKKSQPKTTRQQQQLVFQPPDVSISTSTQQQSPANTTVSATDCMSKFSSLKSPSPMKMNHFDFDVSMDTSMDVNDSVLFDDHTVNAGNGINETDDPTNNYDNATMQTKNDAILSSSSRHTTTSTTARHLSPHQSNDSNNLANKQTKLLLKRNHPSSTTRTTNNMRIHHQVSNNLSTNNSTAYTNLQQEYNVDHSCSTPLERLVRDVGNTFRKWHVHMGCDAHVSLDWGEKMEMLELGLEEREEEEGRIHDDETNLNHSLGESSEVQGAETVVEGDVSMLDMSAMEDANGGDSPVKFMSMDVCERGFANRGRRITSWMGGEDEHENDTNVPSGIMVKSSSSNTPQPQSPPPQSSNPKPRARTKSRPPTRTKSPPGTSSTRKATKPKSHQHGARCIRSQKIQFQTIGYTPETNNVEDDSDVSWNRRRYNIPLVLKLWDAPYFPSSDDVMMSKHADEDARGGDDGCGERIDTNIPRSLQPELSPSSYSLLGELGILSSCGTERPYYNASSAATPSTKNADNGDNSTLKTGLTQDMSTLFNIGQHITLCLDLSSEDTNNAPTGKNENDIEHLYNDIREYIENHIQEAMEAQSRAVRERRRRRRWKQRHHQRMTLKRKQMNKDASRLRQGQKEERQHVRGHGDVTNTYPLVGVGSQSMSYDADEQVVFESEPNNDNNHDQEVGSEYDGDESNDSYNNDDSDDGDDDSLEENDDLHHLNQQEIHAEVTASLTSVLQTALNLAASENDCSLPVFGVWGDYNGDDSGNKDNDSIKRGRKNNGEGTTTKMSSSWIPSGLERNLLQIGDGYLVRRHGEEDGNNEEEDFIPEVGKLLLSSPALSGTCQSSGKTSFRSSHRLYFIPQQVLPIHLSTLNGLANVLLGQCPSSHDGGGGAVVLSAARHCYHWEQQGHISKRDQDWRISCFPSDDDDTTLAVEVYREKCRRQALLILERASSPSIYRPIPIWGPNEGNPLVSLSASVSWGVMIPAQKNDTAVSPPPPLLQLPLKIRSTNFASNPSELLDMEYAMENAALDPIGMGVVHKEGGCYEFGPREPTFLASSEFDMDAPCATLSANTRCVLAALLRCGSLGLDALPGHLTKKEILANFSRQEPVQVAGESTNSEDYLTDTEKILRKAMDLAKVGPVTKRLIDALDWGDIDMDLSAADFDRAITESLGRMQPTTYPNPPVEVFSIGDDMHTKVHVLPGDTRRSQSKGSPPGRLLSVLFAHMARLRTPPSMMRLWLSFVEELRARWDVNESLPNIGLFVPGLDNDGDAQHAPHWGLQKADTRVLGHRADHAAFVNSSEPDPDRDHCIINQKLQVYNICIECKMSTEALHERMQNEHERDVSMGSDESISSKDSSDDDEFFDPEEEEVAFDEIPNRKQIERMLMLQAAVKGPINNRVGARCPVPDGMPLIESGDQLYAPYLQRTMPMTDEEEQKQKKFLGVSANSSREERPSIKSRIAIAQRLQKPKLLSDMSSFKAANYGAVFEDFTRWYGNPENPLSEEVNGETARRAFEYRSKLPPEEAKTVALEEASEAIAILMSLRAFWEDTWEEAEPCPAFEQEPLFDPYSTVEMVLHSFETIHPALLMNQVLAVKLSNARFVLESAAKPARRVRSISRGLANLKAAVDAALERLTKDASDGFFHLAPKSTTDISDPLVYVSTSTITSCEEACNVIGELEILLSRTLPLLQKLPGQYELIDTLLQCKDGRFLFIRCPRERRALLSAIEDHQTVGPNSSPETCPAMREYVLRNLDPSNPCQLSARLVPNLEEAQSASLFHGSLLLALTKSSHS